MIITIKVPNNPDLDERLDDAAEAFCDANSEFNDAFKTATEAGYAVTFELGNGATLTMDPTS